MAQRLIRKLRSKGLVPAVLVSFALAAAFLAAPVGAALRPFLATGYPCTAVTASAAPASPSASGTSITITGTATCPSASPLFQFWYLGQGSSTWQMVKAYSTGNTYVWNSTGALAGTHVFSVWVKDATSSGTFSALGSTYDTFGNTTYTISTASCASATASGAPGSPQAAGASITITGVAAGCSNPSPQYEIWYLGQGSSTWQMVKGYNTTATYIWNSTGALAGTHVFSVWVKDAASAGLHSALGSTYDAFGNTTYTITTPSCTSATVSAAPASPIAHGTTMVTVTGVAVGCTHASPLYEIWYLGQGSSTWQMVKAYNTTAAYVWNTTGALAGTHIFSVWVKDASSPGLHSALGSTYDAFTSPNLTYTLT